MLISFAPVTTFAPAAADTQSQHLNPSRSARLGRYLMERAMRILPSIILLAVTLIVVGLALWLPSLLPAAVLAFIGHAVLTVAAAGAFALYVMSGYARSMAS